MKKAAALLGLIAICLLLPAPAPAAFTKTKIAVLDFQMQGGEFDSKDMGSIVAEWFITAMVKEGRFDVIERRLLAKILEEQQLVMSGLLDESSATRIGKLLGVKVIISGSVMKVRDQIEVNARIIDVENASIIAAESVRSRAATQLQDLIVEMSAKIIKNFPLEGYVVKRSKQAVTLDLGERAGVKPGMEFIIYREGEVIKHPKTRQVLDVERIHTGRLVITNVQGKTSEGEIVSEETPGSVKYGQLVSSAVNQSVEKTRPPPVSARNDNVPPARRSANLPQVPPPPPAAAPAPYYPSPPPSYAGGDPLVSMLRSGGMKQKIEAAKMIVKKGVRDTAVLDVVEDELRRGYMASGRDSLQIDAMSWLCKALGASGNGKYRETLHAVAQNAPHRKLEKYARTSLEMLVSPPGGRGGADADNL